MHWGSFTAGAIISPIVLLIIGACYGAYRMNKDDKTNKSNQYIKY